MAICADFKRALPRKESEPESGSKSPTLNSSFFKIVFSISGSSNRRVFSSIFENFFSTLVDSTTASVSSSTTLSSDVPIPIKSSILLSHPAIVRIKRRTRVTTREEFCFLRKKRKFDSKKSFFIIFLFTDKLIN